MLQYTIKSAPSRFTFRTTSIAFGVPAGVRLFQVQVNWPGPGPDPEAGRAGRPKKCDAWPRRGAGRCRKRSTKKIHEIPFLDQFPSVEKLQTVIAEDIARGVDLPIRLSSPVCDPLRDTALCEIRDGWLYNQKHRELFAKMILDKANKKSTLSIHKEYTQVLQQAVSVVEGKVSLIHAAYRTLLEDFAHCSEIAETLPFLRTIFLFVLGALEKIRLSDYINPNGYLDSQIDEIFSPLVCYYIALAGRANPNELGSIDLIEVLAQCKTNNEM